VISESEEQGTKQESPIGPTFTRISINFNDERCENADDPNRDNSESNPNVISCSKGQFSKQESPIISTLAGIEIDFNDEQFENADDPNPDNLEPD
jgi:hypothetical protein